MPLAPPIWSGFGGCPVAMPKGTVTALVCHHEGFFPWMADGHAPTLYKGYEVTQDTDLVLTIKPDHPGGGGSYPQQETKVISALGAGEIDDTDPDSHIQITNGSLVPGADSGFDTQIIGSYTNRSHRLDQDVSEGDLDDPGTRLEGFKWAAHFVSLTVFQLKTTHQVVHGVAGAYDATYEINAVTQSCELVDPDTDEDAIDRAAVDGLPEDVDGTGDDYGFGAGLYSLWETRPDGTDDYLTFGYRSGVMRLDCAFVMPSVLHRYVIVCEQRDAVGIGDGDDSRYGTVWTALAPITGTFRPTDTTYTTGDITLPIAAGKQTRIKSISLTPIEG